jgi:adenylate kinase
MLNGNRISLVFGLPGAGKTTTLAKVLPLLPHLVRLSGGSLIAGELSTADRDSLRKLDADEILTNQEKLVLNFNSALKQISGKHVVFDGHCMVKDGARIVEIPLSVVKRLCPDKIIFFDVPPVEIVERRLTDRSRPDREAETIAELTTIRHRQIELSRQYAVDLGIPFVMASHENQLFETLRDNDRSSTA